MGERLLCKQEVVGSIPSASTIIIRLAGKAMRIELAPRKWRLVL